MQSGHFEPQKTLQREDVLDMLLAHIESIDFEKAKADVIPFIKDRDALSLWSADFFKVLSTHLLFEA